MKGLVQRLLFLSLLFIPAIAMAAGLTSLQKKELTVFGMKAMGMNVELGHVKNILSNPEIKEMVATGLNMNGHLCAQITDISPLKQNSKYEVSCIAYQGGKAQKTYIVDALNGVAFEP